MTSAPSFSLVSGMKPDQTSTTSYQTAPPSSRMGRPRETPKMGPPPLQLGEPTVTVLKEAIRKSTLVEGRAATIDFNNFKLE